MNLDDLLRDTLTDDRWALPVPVDTLPAVRRKRALRQARLAVAAVAGTGATVAMLALILGGSGVSPATLEGPASAASAGPSVAASPMPIPGSTPAYYPQTARDWFMTDAEQRAFLRHYVEPSPAPEDTVPSPQATGPLTDRLVAAMVAAGVPDAERLQRDEADSGRRGSITVHAKLDGAGLYVNRLQLPYPWGLQSRSSDTDPLPPAAVVEDIPGTDASLAAYPSEDDAGRGLVVVISPTGIFTGWSAPLPLAQLKAWAIAVAQWEAEHPTS